MKQRNSSRPKLDAPKQFVIKHTKRSSSTTNKSRNSSLNTSHSSFPNIQPEEGKLLDLLLETDSKGFNMQMTSFSFNDSEVMKFAFSDDLNNPQLIRNLSFNKNYHTEIASALIQEGVQFSHCLRNQSIREILRAKMVDWMIEVYGNYPKTTSHLTFFRAVNIMDMYLKKTTYHHQDCDLHLIGIACMFISTKVEDIYHIPLSDFVKRVGHNKYTAFQIKQTEFQVMEALQFQVCFPNSMDYIQQIFHKCFNLSDNPHFINIFDTAVYILKMCIHDYNMLSFANNILATVIFAYTLKEYFDAKGNNKDKFKQYQDLIMKAANIQPILYHECFKAVHDLVLHFKQKYPELRNLEKY